VRTRASNFVKRDNQNISIFSYKKGLPFVGFQPANGPRKVVVSLSMKCRICIAQNYGRASWLARTNASPAANMRGNFTQPVPHDSTRFGVSLFFAYQLNLPQYEGFHDERIKASRQATKVNRNPGAVSATYCCYKQSGSTVTIVVIQ
jgi:hypothetical protein